MVTHEPVVRPQKGQLRAVRAVQNKSSGIKRAAEEEETRGKKKPKLEEEVSVIPRPMTENDGRGDRTFSKFLNLPGELRNHIYGFAAATSYAFFPFTWPKRDRLEGRAHPLVRHKPKPLPFIGLSQVCTVIRAEFRPIWLSTHRFPLCALDGYFKAFFPPAFGRSVSKPVRTRIARYTDPVGSLRIDVTERDLGDTDILRLIKHKLRFPDYRVTLVAGVNVDNDTLRYLGRVIDNTSEHWVRWLRGHIVTQVVLKIGRMSQGLETIRVVIKDRYVKEWKRLNGCGALDEIWNVTIGVDYS